MDSASDREVNETQKEHRAEMSYKFTEDEESQPRKNVEFLLPSDIATYKRFNVRRERKEKDPDAWNERIDALRHSIEKQGQLQACIIHEDSDGKRTFCDGEGRLEAVTIQNDMNTQRARPLVRLRCEIQRDATDPFIKAIHANIIRSDWTAVEIGEAIQKLRQTRSLEGPGSGKEIAKMLSIHPKRVQEYDRIMGSGAVAAELRTQLQKGEISKSAALEVLRGKSEIAAGSVLARAQQNRQAREASEAQLQVVMPEQPVRDTDANRAVPKHRAITTEDVQQAVADQHKLAHPVGKSDIVQLFRTFDADQYGARGTVIREFVEAVNDWLAGGKTRKNIVLTRFFDLSKAVRGILGPGQKAQRLHRATGRRRGRPPKGPKLENSSTSVN